MLREKKELYINMERIKKIGIDGKEHTYIVYSEEEIAVKKAKFQKRRAKQMKREDAEKEEQI